MHALDSSLVLMRSLHSRLSEKMNNYMHGLKKDFYSVFTKKHRKLWLVVRQNYVSKGKAEWTNGPN